METALTILKQHGPVAFMLLLTWQLLSGEIQGLDERIRGLDGNIQGLDGSIQELRIEMTEEFKAVRAEMTESNRLIRSDISALGERMARVEIRLASVERVVYAELDPNDR